MITSYFVIGLLFSFSILNIRKDLKNNPNLFNELEDEENKIPFNIGKLIFILYFMFAWLPSTILSVKHCLIDKDEHS